MVANPEPQDPVRRLDSDSPIVQSNTGRPILTDFLEVKRWMVRVRFQELKRPVRESLNGIRENPVAGPKIRRGVMVQSFVDRPAA